MAFLFLKFIVGAALVVGTTSVAPDVPANVEVRNIISHFQLHIFGIRLVCRLQGPHPPVPPSRHQSRSVFASQVSTRSATELLVTFEPPSSDGGSEVTSYSIEWDTKPPVEEVQLITTSTDTGPNEVQTVTTSATHVDEVQVIRTVGDDVNEVQTVRTTTSLGETLAGYFSLMPVSIFAARFPSSTFASCASPAHPCDLVVMTGTTRAARAAASSTRPQSHSIASPILRIGRTACRRRGRRSRRSSKRCRTSATWRSRAAGPTA